MIRMKNYNSFLFPTNPAAITAQFQQRLYIYHHQSCLPSITITWQTLLFFSFKAQKFLLLTNFPNALARNHDVKYILVGVCCRISL